jgi:hypothetical protein
MVANILKFTSTVASIHILILIYILRGVLVAFFCGFVATFRFVNRDPLMSTFWLYKNSVTNIITFLTEIPETVV